MMSSHSKTTHRNATPQQTLCTQQLPVWAPALASSPAQGSSGNLLPAVITDSASALLATHSLLPLLEDSYPMLTEALCNAAGQLAAALQHVAAAPGLCVGAGGPALRAAATAQCVRLRDAFMP